MNTKEKAAGEICRALLCSWEHGPWPTSDALALDLELARSIAAEVAEAAVAQFVAQIEVSGLTVAHFPSGCGTRLVYSFTVGAGGEEIGSPKKGRAK